MIKSRLFKFASVAAFLGAAALWPSGAHAWSLNTQIAFQANTGNLWTWTLQTPGRDTGLGMRAGTSPSVAPMSGIGSDHPIAFQANTGSLWTTGAFGRGDTGLGMQAATSPSIWGSNIAFTANTGELYVNARNYGYAVRYGSSPSIAGRYIAFRGATNGKLWTIEESESAESDGDTVADNTSPKINAKGDVAFQGYNGNLFAGNIHGEGPSNWDTGLGMMPGTSPAINDNNDIAFQANNGNLYIIYNRGNGGGRDTGIKMKPGTSPSISDPRDVAFQGANGNLFVWVGVASRAYDLGLGMKAGTSPSIGLDPGN